MSKTHIDRLRNTNYLGGWDLIDSEGEPVVKTVTIKEIKTEKVHSVKDNEEEEVLTVHFEGCKPIILNSTNRKRLKKVTGTSYIEEMVGMAIQLTAERKRYFGEDMDVVRIVNKSSKHIQKLQKKPSIDNSRFEQALQAVNDGSFSAEKLKSMYSLTKDQLEELNGKS